MLTILVAAFASASPAPSPAPSAILPDEPPAVQVTHSTTRGDSSRNSRDDGRKKKKKQTRLAVAAAKRPLTIGKQNVSIGVDPGLFHSSYGSAFGAAIPVHAGLSKDFELSVAPTLYSTTPHLSVADLGFTWCFLDRTTEVGLRAVTDLTPTSAGLYGDARVGIPIRFHPTDRFAVDVGLFGLFSFNHAGSGLLVPIELTGNLSKKFFLKGGTGLNLVGVKGAGMAVGIPLNAGFGYTIANNSRPSVDLGAHVAWGEVRTFSSYALLADLTFYLYP